MELGLTQEQAADALGVDVRTYRRYETGEVNDPVEGFRLRTAGRRQLIARIGAEFGIGTEELLLEQGAVQDADPWSPRYEHAIQPATHFVGRQRELEQVRRFVRGDASACRVLAVVAVGGSGKSALVERALQELAHTSAAFVWSFYEDPRVDTFLSAAYRYFLRDSAPEASAAALESLVVEIGRNPEHLWVLDGFETVQSDGHRAPRGSIVDPDLRRLVRAFVSGNVGARLLLTSRYPLLDLEAWKGRELHTLELAPLDTNEQLDLLSHYGVNAVGPARAQLESFGGHALSVATLASYVSTFCDGDLSAAEAIGLGSAAGDDMLAFRLSKLLQAYAESIGDALSDLLSRLAAFPNGTDVEKLLMLARGEPAVCGHMPTTRAEIVRGLSHLESLGLVYRNHQARTVFAAHPFVSGYFRDRLAAQGHVVHQALRTQLMDRLVHQPRTAPAAQQLDLLEELLIHTLRANHVSEAFSIYQHHLGGYGGLGLHRGEMNRGHRIARAFHSGPTASQILTQLRSAERGELWYDTALYAIALGDLVQAERSLSEYLIELSTSPRHRTTGLRTQAYALRLAGDFSAALARIDEALRAAPDNEAHLAKNFALRAAILDDLGEVDAAAKAYAEARAYDPVVRFRRALWEAEHAIARGDVAAAAALAESNRAACVRRGWTGHVSHCDVVLGWCTLSSDPEESLRLVEQARKWGFASGEVEALLRSDELEFATLCALGRTTEATNVRDAAQRRAIESGFHRFAMRLTKWG